MQLSDFQSADNLVRLFLDRADELGDAAFLSAKKEGVWTAISWTEAARQVCLLAEALRDMGLQDGDRVMLVSENRPEWCLADLAIMAAGCITTPTYTTNTRRDHVHILDDSGARAVIVSNNKLAQPLISAMAHAGVAEHLIGIEELRAGQKGDVTFHQWGDLVQGNIGIARHATESRVQSLRRRDTACIIYTSGTGGAPRGVKQHHGAILCNVYGAAKVLEHDFGWDKERFLSFLPLSHSYEHTAGQFLPIGMGAEIWYSEGLDKLSGNIEEAQPTLMVVVPRLFEVLRTKIIKQVRQQGKLAERLMEMALDLEERQTNGDERLSDGVKNLILNHTLRPKIRARFGGRLKALVSGGAPLNPEVGHFFQALGMVMLQGYGQTEAAPVVSCNYPSAGIDMKTVGPPLDGVEVAIAKDGEILVRGELVMHEYWRNPSATAASLQDGWLHTGDIGHLDSAGRIVITDRKKDMIVNDKGDNIAPQKIESMLTLQPEIGQAMVHGEQRPYIVALIVPDAEWMAEWAAAQGLSAGQGIVPNLQSLRDNEAFRASLRKAVDRVNEDLSVTEKVRRITLADDGFTIENHELTPSLKIRRHKIRDHYGDRLNGLYRS
ncbi:AMP-dependent synthetase/ligase [Altericroceibacterium endophyticum]|uniref:AMP-binding protein n=1 Tax=Altericroceibacterium endophyticum TaxID=1808508 RepID=A0A6I4T2X8_9SPHN|nr:long-chain fatty acid--CoA ligase [Altericroceibacterium endophyticum]MXO65604.1 AMP-binding protein [Altericroceibacterium endophyticum]